MSESPLSSPSGPPAAWIPQDPGPRDAGPVSDDAGVVMRSPADPSASAAQADWPWEGNHTQSQRKTAIGPTVRTEKLYRSANFPDPSAAESPLQARTGDTGALAAESPGLPGTIDPMTRAPGYSEQSMAAATQQQEQADSVENASGISVWGVIAIDLLVTTVVGFLDMTLNRQFTWMTGIAFVIACGASALLVRQRDLWTAVITPPLAFLCALIIAGQPSTLGGTGSPAIREITLIGTGLAFNAPFVFAGTGLALVIVLLRRVLFRAKR